MAKRYSGETEKRILKAFNDRITKGIVKITINEDRKFVISCEATNWQFITGDMPESDFEELMYDFYTTNMTLDSATKIQLHLNEKEKISDLQRQNELFIKTIHELSKER